MPAPKPHDEQPPQDGDDRPARGSEDRLVREMLNYGGYRVWVADDVDEWKKKEDFIRTLLRWWNSGGKEAVEFAEKRLHVRTSRQTSWGKFLWALLSAMLTVGGGLFLTYVVPSLLR